VLHEIRRVLTAHVPFGDSVLDPFAGIGKIHSLRPAWETWGIELEPEWAYQSSNTICTSVMDAAQTFSMPFSAIATSCCYANRMADSHKAKDASKRITYTHTLGRALTDGNAGSMQWGEAYRDFHRGAWATVVPLLKPQGIFVLNISDHLRTVKRGGPQLRMPVEAWHLSALSDLGLHLIEARRVTTRRQGFGANGKARVDGELVAVLRRD
jgi:hypothetical protein